MSEKYPHPAAEHWEGFGDNVTLDIIDQSHSSWALRTALRQGAAQLRHTAGRRVSRFVEEALRPLLLLHCDFTLTDFRCVRLGSDDRRPRAWGCYRLTHTPSGEWVEVVTSHLCPSGAAERGPKAGWPAERDSEADQQADAEPGPELLMTSMAIALHGLLFRLQVDDWESMPSGIEVDEEYGGATSETRRALTDRPTQPGWPPYEAMAAC